MKTKNLFYLIIMLFAGTMLISSCEKEKSGFINEQDLAVIEDEVMTANLYEDIMSSIDNAVKAVDEMIYGGGLKSAVVSDECPLITVDHPDEIYWPKVITIDYGTGCEGFYGQTRSGKIVITITERYRAPGSVKTVELVNYVINGIAVEGTKTIENLGRNENSNLEFSISLVDGKVTTPNGIVINREFNRLREWVSGEDTFNRWDDVYFITGEASGTNWKGDAYTRTITNPLEVAASCRFIKSGTVVITVEGRSQITLDYGNGNCDNEATVTKDGETRTILLKYRHRIIKP